MTEPVNKKVIVTVEVDLFDLNKLTTVTMARSYESAVYRAIDELVLQYSSKADPDGKHPYQADVTNGEFAHIDSLEGFLDDIPDN